MKIFPLIAVYSFIFLSIFTLLLFFFIIVRRIIIRSQEKKLNRQYKEIEKDILKAISLTDERLSLLIARRYKGYHKALIKVLFDYIEVVSGPGREQLKIIFDNSLKRKYLKELDSPKLRKRLRATRLFAFFPDSQEINKFVGLFEDKPIIMLAAISALSKIASPRTISFIFQAFWRDPNPNMGAYFNVMLGIGEDIEPYVKKSLKKSLSSEKLGILIEVIGHLHLRNLYSDILAYSDHEDKEIRTKLARALGNLSVPEAINTLKKLSSDSNWQVRTQAIKSLGKLKSLDSLDILTHFMFSPLWYERLNAGYALGRVGAPGIARLRELSKQKEDRFASEMAAMILNNFIYFGRGREQGVPWNLLT